MSRDRCRTLGLIERIARVREAQARQHLADAIEQEREQRERVEATSDRFRAAEQALAGLRSREALDLPRLGLYQELASSIDAQLVNENNVLYARLKARAVRSGELAHQTHYREHVSERLKDAIHDRGASREARTSDERLEAWVLRGAGEKP